MLSSLFKRELGRTVNASECVARGCAMLSPVFRVRDYEVGSSHNQWLISLRLDSSKYALGG